MQFSRLNVECEVIFSLIKFFGKTVLNFNQFSKPTLCHTLLCNTEKIIVFNSNISVRVLGDLCVVQQTNAF